MNRPERDSAYRLGGPGGGLRPGAVIAVALAAAFLVWLLFIRGDDEEGTESAADTAQVSAIGPIDASERDIAELAEEEGEPIYWAGEIDGTEVELTRTTDGNVYVRYLDQGTEIGDPDPFLTVSTYPFEDAFNALGVVSERPGATTETLDDGALVVGQGDEATSAYVAYPGEDVQVEVFDPDAGQALELATSGDIRAVE